MPALTNPKYERYAQELAKGKTADDAYAVAGYKQNRKNASRLKANEDILGRIAELLAERESIHAQATADAVKSLGLTKGWVIETLMENVAKAMQATAMRNENGDPIGEFQYQGSVANKALEKLVTFKPDLLVVSAGFDAYARDPLLQMSLEPEDFATFGQWLSNIGIPVAVVLEGGYSDDLPELIDAFLTAWQS